MVGGLLLTFVSVPRDGAPVSRRHDAQRPSTTRCASTGCRRWCWCCAASSVCSRAPTAWVSPAQRGARAGHAAHAPRVLRSDSCVRVRDAARRRVEQSRHLWIAVELTTLASVFLVTFHDRDTSLEAALEVPDAGQPRPRVRAARHGAAVRRPGRDIWARACPRCTGRASCRWRLSCTPSRCGSASCSR